MSAPDPMLDAAPMPPPVDDTGPFWHRLSAWMIIVRPMHEVVGALPVIVLLLITGEGGFWRVIWPLVIVGLILLRGLVYWWRTSYTVGEEQVELHTGLLARKRLTVRRERIRTVESTAKFGHRMFGLTEVRIGTGQNQQTKQQRRNAFTLDGVTLVEAERLRLALLRRGSTTDQASEPGQAAGSQAPPTSERATGGSASTEPAGAERTLRTLDRSWLRYAPLTLSGLTSVGVIVGAAFKLFSQAELAPSDLGFVRDVVTWIQRSPLAEIVAVALGAVLVIATLFSLVGYTVQFWNYRLSREPDGSLRVRRGLFTTRSLSIEQARLHGVLLREQLLLRAGGGARLTAIATGLHQERRAEVGLLLPPAPRPVAQRVAAQALRVRQSPVTAPLTGHPRRALWRRQTRATGTTLVLAAVLAACSLALGPAWPDWPWITALALTPVAAALGVDRYRNLGHALTKRYLVTRWGSLRRGTAALRRSGIIGWRIRSSFFQRRVGLASLTATTAAGRGDYRVTDLDHADAVALADAALPGLLEPFLVAGGGTTDGDSTESDLTEDDALGSRG